MQLHITKIYLIASFFVIFTLTVFSSTPQNQIKIKGTTRTGKFKHNEIKLDFFFARVPETYIKESFFLYSFVLAVERMYRHGTLPNASK